MPASVPPAPRPVPFPSNIAGMLCNNISIILRAAYEEQVAISPGPPRMAFITGEAALRRVMQKTHHEFPKSWLQNEILAPLFGEPMLSVEGADWR